MDSRSPMNLKYTHTYTCTHIKNTVMYVMIRLVKTSAKEKISKRYGADILLTEKTSVMTRFLFLLK